MEHDELCERLTGCSLPNKFAEGRWHYQWSWVCLFRPCYVCVFVRESVCVQLSWDKKKFHSFVTSAVCFIMSV